MLEVTVVIAIIGVILSMAIPSYVSRINQAKYEKTVNELTAIAQASIDYFNLTGSLPDPILWPSQLSPQFMPHAVTLSPFGTSYQIILPTSGNNMITVSVLIPKGIAQNNSQQGQLWVKSAKGTQDEIEITKTVQNEITSRLSYCRNNFC